ncbi:pentatricopeptide repeat-containing protein At1g53600, mitochondrial [Aristolochia californica]|uniref:pentatricopeptide repeat-containing protein At1g53600, mitochondrial n=1 Tax=Aristolochia californica TaxID=171875 RepID=UPI0035DFEEAF
MLPQALRKSQGKTYVFANSDIKKLIVSCNYRITENGRKGNLEAAESIFHSMPTKTVVSWTALLSAYADNGKLSEARAVFDEMPERNVASWNAMMTAYVRSLRIDDAFDLLCTMPSKNSVSYTVIMTGFINAGMLDEAEKFYSEMPVAVRDPGVSNALISGYLKRSRLEDAVCVFRRMFQRDVLSWSSILDGYCKTGRITDARDIFERMPERNVVSWTSLIGGYLRIGMWNDGFELLSRMRRESCARVNSITLTMILDACANMVRLAEGIQIHGLVTLKGFGFDPFLCNSLMNMYSSVGWVADASKVFRLMDKKDLVSWNSLIGGYVQNNELEKAFENFLKMPKRDAISWTSIVVGFSNRGRMEESVYVFENMPEKDDVAWTAIISGFLGNGQYVQALSWFVRMLRDGAKPNSFTISSALSATAEVAVLDQGVQIHVHVLKMCLDSDLSVQSSLISMYAKCGNVHEAYQIFTSISEPNLVSINSMITGFAQHGFVKEALEVYRQMQTNGHEPNSITFLGVLSACVHAGLVNEGLDFFKSMICLYQIEPGPSHYVCIIDLLGRSGRLKEALALVNSMPFEPNSAVWGALLSASRNHMDVDLAKLAAQNLFQLEPQSGVAYAVLSNMYAEVGLQEEEQKIRMMKKLRGVRKQPGCSWIIVGNKVHLFLSGDQSHVEFDEIQAVLRIFFAELEYPDQKIS